MPAEGDAALLDLPADLAPVGLERRADPDHVGSGIRERDRGRGADAAAAARYEHRRSRERGAHARQSIRIFIEAGSPSLPARIAGNRLSGSTELIMRSSGSVPEAISSIARS